MIVSTDDFVKLALTVSLCFAIIGIAFQFMRMLSELVVTVKQSNSLLTLLQDFLEKFMEDYDYIVEQVKSIVESVGGFSRSVFVPLSRMFGFLKKIEKMPFMRRANKDTEA